MAINIASATSAAIVHPGTMVTVYTDGTYADDASVVSITYDLLYPINSKLRSVTTVDSKVYIVPDVVGIYIVRVTATSNTEATAATDIRITALPTVRGLGRKLPDVSVLKDNSSTFISAINNRDVIYAVWQEYLNITADILGEVVYSAAAVGINTIPETTVKKTALVRTKTDIGVSSIKLMTAAYGDNATTTPEGTVWSAIVTEDSTVKVIQPFDTNITHVTVTSGTYVGTYGVVTDKGNDSIKIDAAIPSTLIKETSGKLNGTVTIYLDTSLLSAGDVLSVAGSVTTIVSVGSTYVSVSPIVKAVGSYIVSAYDTLPVTVSVSKGESYNTILVTDETIPYNILKESNVIANMTHTSGNSFKSKNVIPKFTLVRDSSTGSSGKVVDVSFIDGGHTLYKVDRPMYDGTGDSTITFTLRPPVVGSLITTDFGSYPVAGTTSIVTNVGTVATVFTTVGSIVSATSTSWHVGSTIEDLTGTDFEHARRGDTVVTEVYDSISDSISNIDLKVIGALGNKISFEAVDVAGTGLYVNTLVNALRQLNFPGSDSLPATGLSLDISKAIYNTEERTTSIVVDSGEFINATLDNSITIRVKVEPKFLRHNSRSVISGRPVSIPFITEFVYSKAMSKSSNGYVTVRRDGSIIEQESDETLLIENVHYSVVTDGNYRGTGSKLTDSESFIGVLSFFVANGVKSGDTLITNYGSYVIRRVVSDTELILLVTEDEYKGIVHLGEFLISVADSSIIMYVDGVIDYNVSGLVAHNIVESNNEEIEYNFGSPAGFLVSDYSDLRNRMSYKDVVTLLTYAYIKGGTVDSVTAALSALAGITVTTKRTVVESIVGNDIVLREISKEGEATNNIRVVNLPTVSVVEPFSLLKVNDATKNIYAVGDVVDKYTSLSGSVILRKELDPLLVHHNWVAILDLSVVDTLDMPIIAYVANRCNPAHNRMRTVGVKLLTTDIAIEETINIHATVLLYDDVDSLPTTHSVDTTSRLDDGRFTYRTLTGGEGSVTGNILTTSFEYFADDATPVPLHSSFNESVDSRNTSIKVGDYIRVYSGQNTGIYEIGTIDSSTSVTLVEATSLSSYSRLPFIEEDNLEFEVLRYIAAYTLTSSCSSVVYDSGTDTTDMTFTGVNFISELVSVHDRVVLSTTDYVAHEVLEVASSVLTVSGNRATGTYTVLKPTLLPAYVDVNVVATTVGDRAFVHIGTNLHTVRRNMTLRIEGSDVEYTVIRVTSTEIVVDSPIDVVTSLVTVRTGNVAEDADNYSEVVTPADNVTAILTSATATVSASALSITSRLLTTTGTFTGVVSVGDIIELRDTINSASVAFRGLVIEVNSTTSVTCTELEENSLVITTNHFSKIYKYGEI